MQQLTKNVFVETNFKGANVSFVVTREGVVMIDTPGVPTQARQWRQQVEKHAAVRYLINTEPHVDHISGAFFFPGIMIAQEGVRRVLSRPETKDQALGWMKMEDPDGVAKTPDYRIRLPDITFSAGLTLYLGDHTFEIRHLPGHTQYNAAIHVPQERVLFTGDNVVYQRQPYFVDSRPLQWVESLKTIGDFDVDYIVPGHGEVCKQKSYVQEFRGFIQGWLDAVQKAIQEGKSKEAVMNSISFLDRYPMNPGQESYGPELQRQNAGKIYDLLTRPQSS